MPPKALTLPYEQELTSGRYRIRNRGNTHYPKQLSLEVFRPESDKWDEIMVRDEVKELLNEINETDTFLSQKVLPEIPVEPRDEAAANWWAEVVAKGGKKDNGEIMHGLMGALVTDVTPKPTDEKAALFGKLLARFISRRRKHYDIGGYIESPVTLSCDYNPCWDLYRIGVVYCGISDNLFPWKTCMWVYPEHVIVRYGYGVPEQMLYGTHHKHTFTKTGEIPYENSQAARVLFECSNCGYPAETYKDAEHNIAEKEPSETYGWTRRCEPKKP